MAEDDTRYNRARGFLSKFNESDTAADLPLETKRKAFLEAEQAEAEKEDKNRRGE